MFLCLKLIHFLELCKEVKITSQVLLRFTNTINKVVNNNVYITTTTTTIIMFGNIYRDKYNNFTYKSVRKFDNGKTGTLC